MPLTPDQFTNFAASLLVGGAGGIGSPLNPADTTLTLTSGDGILFPATGPFMLTLGPGTISPEIVKVTARSGDVLTIVRAQEGTSAQTWTAGTVVQHVVTALNMNNLWGQITTLFGSPALVSLSLTGTPGLTFTGAGRADPTGDTAVGFKFETGNFLDIVGGTAGIRVIK